VRAARLIARRLRDGGMSAIERALHDIEAVLKNEQQRERKRESRSRTSCDRRPVSRHVGNGLKADVPGKWRNDKTVTGSRNFRLSTCAVRQGGQSWCFLQERSVRS